MDEKRLAAALDAVENLKRESGLSQEKAGKPTPITGDEETFMRLIINGGVPIPESTADVDNDRNVTVTGGWLKGNEQYIIGYNIRKKRALLEIRFGGRIHRTSVGVEYTKV